MPSLAEKHCAPVASGSAPLSGAALRPLAGEVPEWEVAGGHELRREFRFPDFAQALQFVNAIGAIAESEQHHPDICFGWGKVAVTTWTHSVHGLSENDFILAARIDRLRRAG